jgi:tRNA(adenine34) deaminase
MEMRRNTQEKPRPLDPHITDDEYFMRLALEQARIAASLGEVPVGAVVVRNPALTTPEMLKNTIQSRPNTDGRTSQNDASIANDDRDEAHDEHGESDEAYLVSAAYNRREIDNDPSAHAEFIALRQASQELGRWRLSDCTVYVTLEPCSMCAGMMQQARIKRCVYGADDPKAGATGSLYRLHDDGRLNHSFQVSSGVLEEESSALLKEFFAGLRLRRQKAKLDLKAQSLKLQSCTEDASEDPVAEAGGKAELEQGGERDAG